MAPYRTLKAWQHAQRLAVECAKAAKVFPAYEQGALADQLRRAAYSVSLNIAEGSARRGSREYRKFLDTANSSMAEVESALDLARQLEYVSQPEYDRIAAIATETGKTLWGLLRKISDGARATT
jgi:four helix bundle protein